MCAVALLVKIPVYFFFGLYRRLWMYASTSELRLITVAVTTASVLTSGVMLLLINFELLQPGMPRSALGIDWLISLVLIGGSRFALRILAEQTTTSRAMEKPKRALIIGAGDAGALVVRELQKSSQLNLIPVGFLDDDPAKQKHQIYGVSVIGKVNELADVLDNQHVDEVIIAIPSAPGSIIRLVNDVCRQKGISSRTMPGIYELIGGKVSVNRLREVDITDLLRREPVRIDDHWWVQSSTASVFSSQARAVPSDVNSVVRSRVGISIRTWFSSVMARTASLKFCSNSKKIFRPSPFIPSLPIFAMQAASKRCSNSINRRSSFMRPRTSMSR